MSVAVGHRLLKHHADRATVRINSRREPSHAATVIGRTPENHPARIVICAHYDTKYGTPGAQDNGAGMAAMLALAESLPRRGLPIGLEFVAWADEEYGAHTDAVYAAQTGAGFAEMLCAINIDGIGLLTENITFTLLAHSAALEQTAREVTAGYPDIVWVEPWIQSNHFTYFSRGVPTVALTSLTFERTHQADDTLAWIDPEQLDMVVGMLTSLIQKIQDQLPAWARPSAGSLPDQV